VRAAVDELQAGSAAAAAAVTIDSERQAELVRAYIAGYGQALEDFRSHVGVDVHARRRRSPLRWARAAARILGARP
jgi:hypothetical protein